MSDEERARFRESAGRLNRAADRIIARESNTWPRSLRVKAVQGAPGIFEMTWSFSGPDGRATFEWVTVTDDGDLQHPAIKWRRIGKHSIFRRP
jgi:hypothetical protein